MKSLTKNQTGLFLLFTGLFLMQDKLQDWYTPFQYFDESFGLLVLPLCLMRVAQKRKTLVWTKRNVLFCVLLTIFWLCGWAGHFVYQYQPLVEAAKDSYVNIKFFLAAAAAFLIFYDENTDFRQLKATLWPILNTVTVELFVLCLIDLAFGVFSAEFRGPLRAVKLFYSAYTVLVGNCILLSSVYLWYYEDNNKKIIPYLLMLAFIVYSTRRVKGIGAIACIVPIYLLLLRGNHRISRKVKLFVGCLMLLAAAAGLYQLVSYYFIMGTESARAMLTLASPFIAWDHFPTGSGWATFGSAFSADPYSPVYGMYRMAGIWGISPDYPAFVSDTYWPMLLAETGFFGFVAFISALVLFVKMILVPKSNRSSYASGIMILLYLLISSTSESALANPIAVPMAFWLGFLLAEHRATEQENPTCEAC